MRRDAVISPCSQYRYRLSRSWDVGGTVLWLMLNPSTADANVDDPTIRRCIAFSRTWGYAALYVGNMFALRATDPAELRRHPDPGGIGNTLHLREMAKQSSLIVAAWGADSLVTPLLARSTLGNLSDCAPIKCLGRTKSGAPRHPLYVAAATELQDYLP